MEIHIPLSTYRRRSHGTDGKLQSSRSKSDSVIHYVHACIRLDLSSTQIPVPDDIPPVQLCFTVRQALDSTLVELFGQLTGASLLSYDLLQCKSKNSSSPTEFACSIILAVNGTHLDHLLTAVSLLNLDVGGFHMLGLLPALTESERGKIVVFGEVHGVHNSLFSINFDLDS
ncbi:hypothetical protein FBUS_01818 [Fasciolopsis buskii]|uniref:Uncharacterized protein n=1 Tax=Fasciolopsis buskii TaxID=27845 RepID=A0A8E0RUP8_9TREM|nr:hypothetical protein FBUS_01818 [Fasciolopsis buski]